MKAKTSILLICDAVINLSLGVLLLLYPLGVPANLGLPQPETYFYTTILGGVLFGIGVALLIEGWQKRSPGQGLGLAGAIAINLCGGGALLYGLVGSDLDLPVRGQVLLWAVAVLVIGIGLIELISGAWRTNC